MFKTTISDRKFCPQSLSKHSVGIFKLLQSNLKDCSPSVFFRKNIMSKTIDRDEYIYIYKYVNAYIYIYIDIFIDRKRTIYIYIYIYIYIPLGLTCDKQIPNSPKSAKSWNLFITGSLLGQVIVGIVWFEENPWFWAVISRLISAYWASQSIYHICSGAGFFLIYLQNWAVLGVNVGTDSKHGAYGFHRVYCTHVYPQPTIGVIQMGCNWASPHGHRTEALMRYLHWGFPAISMMKIEGM